VSNANVIQRRSDRLIGSSITFDGRQWACIRTTRKRVVYRQCGNRDVELHIPINSETKRDHKRVVTEHIRHRQLRIVETIVHGSNLDRIW